VELYYMRKVYVHIVAAQMYDASHRVTYLIIT